MFTFRLYAPVAYSNCNSNYLLPVFSVNMGKIRKSKMTRNTGVSLADQVLEDRTVNPTGRMKSREREEKDDEVCKIWLVICFRDSVISI